MGCGRVTLQEFLESRVFLKDDLKRLLSEIFHRSCYWIKSAVDSVWLPRGSLTISYFIFEKWLFFSSPWVWFCQSKQKKTFAELHSQRPSVSGGWVASETWYKNRNENPHTSWLSGLGFMQPLLEAAASCSTSTSPQKVFKAPQPSTVCAHESGCRWWCWRNYKIKDSRSSSSRLL